jgi:hypothetical protein
LLCDDEHDLGKWADRKSQARAVQSFSLLFSISLLRLIPRVVKIIASLEQGCQILLGATYQNGGKYTKLPQNTPNVHKVYQIAVK